MRFPAQFRRVALAACLITVSFAASAQQSPAPAPSGVTGHVLTSNNTPIPGATVKLTNAESGKTWISWTDASGKFEFPNLPDGPYHAEASQLGFIPAPTEITVPVIGSEKIEIVLRVATLDELAAGASPANAPTAKPAQPSAAASATNAPGSSSSQSSPQNASNNPASNGGSSQPGRGRNRGANSQLPPGVANALSQGMASGGFQQTDLTAEMGEQQNESPGATAGAAGGSSSDSFLLNGTVGQGLNAPGGNGPGGPFGAFGPPGMGGPGQGVPGMPGGGGQGPGGFPGGNAQGPFGGPVGQLSPGGTAAIRFGQGGFPGGPGGGGPGGGGPRGGGGGRGGGRFLRQAVNRVRFSFFNTYENSAFDARPYSLTGIPEPKISHYSDKFGGNIGGPLKIPHIYNGTDRTFFFLNYTHQNTLTPLDTFATVPSQAEREGDFCGTGLELFNPASSPSGPRTPLPCQLSKINPAAAGLLKYVPLPNLPGAVQNFNLETTEPVGSDFVNLHLLHTISSKFNLQGGYNFNSTRENTIVNFPLFGSYESIRNQSANIGLTQNWTPRLVQNTQLNYSRSRTRIVSDNSFKNNIAGDLGIMGISETPIDWGVPEIGFTNFTGLSDPVPSLVRNQTFRLMDSLTYSLSKHTFTFGGELRRLQFNTDSDPTPRGSFTFTGLMTSQLTSGGQQVPGTGSDFADFLLGLPQSTYTRFGSTSQYLRSWGFIGYAQDDWHVNPRLTFDYGVRYEAMTPPVSVYNTLANIDVNSSFTRADVVTPGSMSLFNGVYPRSLVRGDYNNWAPRIGLAWKPVERMNTVVRAGYSIFYNDSICTQLANYLSNQPPWAEADTRTTSAAQTLTLQDGFPGQGKSTLTNTAAVDPNYKIGYAQIWDLGTETQLPGYWVLGFTYIGTKGTDLDLLLAPNRPPVGTPLTGSGPIPGAGNFTYDESGANSIYNALQVRVLHRFTHGLMFQALYTFGKSIDDASSIGGGAPTIVQNDDDIRADRGLSSFDIRHQLRMTSVYELPFGERKRWFHHGFAEHMLGNLRLMSLLTFQTGTPYTGQILSAAAGNSGTGTNFSTRADQIGNPSYGFCGGSTAAFFNTAAFALPPGGEFGDAARNTISGPCTVSLNVSLARSWRFGPENHHRVDARWEVNNLTNTPSFSGLSTIVGSSTFGRVTGAGSMRTMDLVVRFNF